MVRWILLLCITCPGLAGAAGINAVTDDGRAVILSEDGTWKFAEDGTDTEEKPATDAPASNERVYLSVERKVPLKNGCKFGLRLRNGLSGTVKNVVPQITAHLSDDTAYENVFVGFQRIKPTRSQYDEISFSGIACDEIAYLKVGGADRCNMAGLTTYTGERGACLALIEVEPSEFVKISK